MIRLVPLGGLGRGGSPIPWGSGMDEFNEGSMDLAPPGRTLSIQKQAMGPARGIQSQAADMVLQDTGLDTTDDMQPSGDEEQSDPVDVLQPGPPVTSGNNVLDISKKTSWWPWAVGGGVLLVVIAVGTYAVVRSRRKRR
jgi:hypothetical protein